MACGLHEICPELEIFIYDNNSSDSSARIALNLSQNYPKIHLRRAKIQGKGAVIRQAFRELDFDFYLMIDADSQYDLNIAPRALKHAINNKIDMLNIARNAESNTHRRFHSFGNAAFSRISNMLFKTQISDILSGYRIFSRGFVKSFCAHSDGFEIETEISIFALSSKLNVDEILAPYFPRPENSFSKLHTFKDGFKIAKMIIWLLLSERPLFCFGILGILCFILGFIIGLPILFEFLETQRVARFPSLFFTFSLGVIGVVLWVCGLLAHLVAKNAKEARLLAYLREC